MVIPIIDYGDIFFESGAKGLLDKLNSLQRRAIGIILKMREDKSVEQAMSKLNIMHLETQRNLHLLQHVKWLVDNGKYMDDRQIATRAHTGLRRNQSLQVPKSTKYLRSFLYRGLSAGNNLDECIHAEKDCRVFKTMVKADLIGKENKTKNKTK